MVLSPSSMLKRGSNEPNISLQHAQKQITHGLKIACKNRGQKRGNEASGIRKNPN